MNNIPHGPHICDNLTTMFRALLIGYFCLTGTGLFAAPEVVINEFVAVNELGHQDEDNAYSDWIELFNPSDDPVNLDGWFLTDDAGELDKWRMPAVTLASNAYLVIFASDKNRTNALSELHTNFRLAGDGEYLALVRPDGSTVEHDYDAAYPDQSSDQAYGLVREMVDLLPQGAEGRFLIPSDGSLGTSWIHAGFDDSAWTNAQSALGFDSGAGGYPSYFFTDVSNQFFDVNDSLYLRVPFAVGDLLELESAELHLQCDDGFKAYLNGQPLASARAPANPVWNDAATSAHPDLLAVVGESFPIPLSDLQSNNLLAIHGLNVTPDDSDADFLLVPEITARVRTPSYLEIPTPGAANAAGLLLAPVSATPGRGFYSNAVQVVLSSEVPGVEIRYTTDFIEPTTNSMLYVGPVTVANTTVLRAAAFKDGFQHSPFVTHTYVYHEQILTQPNNPPGWPSIWGSSTASYLMRSTVIDDHTTEENIGFLKFLPTVSIVSEMDHLFHDTTGIYDHPNSKGTAWERSSSVEWIHPDGTPGFGVNCGLRIQGGLGGGGRNYIKKSWRLLFKSKYGPSKLRFPIFTYDENATEEFDQLILRAGGNDRQDYTRDEYARRTATVMGAPTAHGRHVHVYLNGIYWGMYNLAERPAGDFASQYFGGGDKDNWDALAHNGNNIINGDNQAWNAMILAGRAGLADNAAYQQFQGNHPDGTRNPAYPVMADIPNYINYMLANIYLGMGDWPGHNWYAARQRGEDSTGYKFFIWDGEGAFRSSDVTGVNNNLAEPYDDLRANDEFNLRFGDIAHKHMFNGGVLTPAVALDRHNALSDTVEFGTVMEQARWGHTGLDGWRSTRSSRQNYLAGRRDVVLGYLRGADLYPETDAPMLAPFGGDIGPGSNLNMTSGNALNIYYTTDGRDPREYDTGAITGETFTGPLVLEHTVRVMARARGVGNEWSALVEALYVVPGETSLRVSEIMYNPRKPVGSETNVATQASAFEFIEFENTGKVTLGLANLRISGGVDFDFGSGAVAALNPGASVVIVSDLGAFTNRYTNWREMQIAGTFSGSLDNDGDGFNLNNQDDETLLSVDYRDGRGWPLAADGAGHSLVPFRAADQMDGALDYPGNWRASSYLDGSPGTSDPDLVREVLLNEIVAHTDVNAPPYDSNDQIELFNNGDTAIPLGDWYLSDDADDLRKWVIPSNRSIPSRGWILFDEMTGFHQPITEGFGLNKNGEQVFLSYLPGTAQDRVVDAVAFKGQENGAARGRYSDGGSCWYHLQPTPGLANRLPDQDVVISEIMYDPAPMGTNTTDNTRDEFLEICNTTGQGILLQSPAGPWRVDGIDYRFPSNTTLQANESILLVSFDPVAHPGELAAFRIAHGITNASVRILGPYLGKLANGGECLALERPQLPDLPDDSVSWVVLDEVIYFNQLPWPAGANATGFSIERLNPKVCGSFPLNWQLSDSTGGTPGKPCEVPLLPLIAIDPPRLDVRGIEDVNALDQTFSVWNMGTGTLQYTVSDDQIWLDPVTLNGSSLEGASSPAGLSFSTETLAVGIYTAIVSVTSATAANSPRSMEVVLQVTARDKIAPEIDSVFTRGNPNQVLCVFTETMQADAGLGGANLSSNYQVDQGVVVTGAQLHPDGKTVTLNTSTLSPAVDYTLTVTNLLDRGVIPNTVPPGESMSFQYIYTEPVVEVVTGGVFAVNTTVLLDGTGSHDEDGGPLPLSYQWSVLLAPEPLTIIGADQALASVTLNRKGTYVMRLSVSDGVATRSKDVIFVVTDAVVLIPAGAVWKYHDLGADLGTAWRMPDYDDSSWLSGPAELGYGDQNEATELSYGPDASRKYTTTYFRVNFVVEDISNIAGLTAQFRRDDGGIIYLNGSEIVRSNMRPGPPAYNIHAASTVGGADETTYFPFSSSATNLVAGTNVVAVEIHQGNGGSSDISFDLALFANVYEIDADSDDMADIWEAVNFGGTNELGLADFDLDGVNNVLEYGAGTDPTDPNSLFALEIENMGAQNRILFQTYSLAGLVFQLQQRVYDLETTTDLMSSWTPVPGYTGIIGDDQPMIHTTPPGRPPSYYRVKVRIE
ncbi:MAG: hypothetical protein ACI97B_000591 [Verrucomicrobiales bacterium]|jgi:hypothetical protein